MQWCPQDLILKDLALGRKGTELASFLDLLTQKVGDEGAVGYGAPSRPIKVERPMRVFLPVAADRIKLPDRPANIDLSQWLPPGLWMSCVVPRSLRS